MGLRGVQEGPEPPQLLCWLEAHEVSETGFGEPGDPLVLVRQVQGLCTDLLIQPEETQVGRNRGAGGAAEPRQLTLGVGLAGLYQLAVVEGLLEGIWVFVYFEAARTVPTADADERGVPPMSLINMELIPDAGWFSESNLWATKKVRGFELYTQIPFLNSSISVTECGAAQITYHLTAVNRRR